MKFDISSWSQRLTSADFREFYRSQRTPIFERRGFGLIFAAIFFLALNVGAYFLLTKVMEPSILSWIFVGAIDAAIVASYVWWLRKLTRSVRLAKLAKANNLQFRALIKNFFQTGTAFARGMNSQTRPAIYDSEKDFLLGRYYVEPSQNQSGAQIRLPFTFASFRLPSQAPHIIAKNVRSRIIPTSGLAGQNASLKLEGEFAKTFTLFCPKKYERDALYIFTPDVMAAILNCARDCEIEIVDDRLFVYSRSDRMFHDPENLAKMFAVMDELKKRFAKQTKLYRDERSQIGNVAPTARRMRSSR